MIKAIIVEDEFKAGELLEGMLQEIDKDILIVEKCRDLPAAIKSIKKNSPDLVFLDIELPVYNGLQLLEFLTPEEINFKIIFTTASNEHALKAFEMSAVDYLLKPIQYDKLERAIKKFASVTHYKFTENYKTLKENLSEAGIKKIIIPQTNGFEIVKLDEIIFIKAEGSYAKIYLKNEKLLMISHNLKYFEDLLREIPYFLRIHRSHLVNVHFAKRISRNNGNILVMENEMELPVSSERIDNLLSFFNFKKA